MLICHKTQPTNQLTNQPNNYIARTSVNVTKGIRSLEKSRHYRPQHFQDQQEYIEAS